MHRYFPAMSGLEIYVKYVVAGKGNAVNIEALRNLKVFEQRWLSDHHRITLVPPRCQITTGWCHLKVLRACYGERRVLLLVRTHERREHGHERGPETGTKG